MSVRDGVLWADVRACFTWRVNAYFRVYIRASMLCADDLLGNLPVQRELLSSVATRSFFSEGWLAADFFLLPNVVVALRVLVLPADRLDWSDVM